MAKNKAYVITRQTLSIPNAQALSMVETLSDCIAEECQFIVIDFDEHCALETLKTLRQTPDFQLLPIYYLGTPPRYHELILDGMYDKTTFDKAQAILERLPQLGNPENNLDAETTLLRYLYVRKSFSVRGVLDYRTPAGVQYPLIQLLIGQSTDMPDWLMLQSMEHRKLLAIKECLDEIQTCTHCESGLLNFKNCCPACQSTKINNLAFVHCFTCGNIGPLNEFLRHEELVCTRCQVKLRHIGIDYDKPIEDKVCIDCHHNFFEADVKAACMVCSKLSNPEDLHTLKIYDYQLAHRGEQIAKGIEQRMLIEFGAFKQLIELPVFMMIMKWQLLVARRYKTVSFSLMAIKVMNEDELLESFGVGKTEKMLMEFFNRVRSLFRDTDLVTVDERTVVLYLPMTPPQGCVSLYDRILSFSKEQRVLGHAIKIGLSNMYSGDILEQNIPDDFLVAELYNRITEHG